MDSSVNWIRIFDITDTNKHPKGFIIYKVTSMLYPEKCPEAVTRLTVWKRYNDLKKLYRDMKILHGKHNIIEKFPTLQRGKFFKKYDSRALQDKKQSALNFLEYIGRHHQLFTSTEFVKFFETSHTPTDNLSGNINSIRADLNLPEDPEYSRYSEEDQSDTDSVSTFSSINLDTSIVSSSSSRSVLKTSQNSDSISQCTIESLTLLDGQVYSSPESPEVYIQYIIDASMHIKLAEELENDRKYEESFIAYKTAIDILLKFGQSEEDYDRKRLVKYKTEKYLVRAEKLYNMFLAPEVRNLRKIFEKTKEKPEIQPPLMSDLYKYNVVRIIDTGMLVVHSETQRLYYVKVIHKTTKFLDENLILPENVPFMVQLYNYYNCDNALFLVLEYVNGVKLSDYLKQIRKEKPLENLEIFEKSESDDESEKSFSDLVKDYAKFKQEDVDDFVKISHNESLIDEPIPERFNGDVEQNSDLLRINLTIKWIAQLILALEKLHILGVTCKTLRSRNILIDEHQNLRLTYMCNIKEFGDIYKDTKDLNLPPELHGIIPVKQDADWWSLGAILYELLVGMDLNEVHPQSFCSNTIVKIPRSVSAEGRSLLRQLLVYEGEKRLGAGNHGIENLKTHPFFKGVDWNFLLGQFEG